MNPGPAISILRTRPCGSWSVATSRSATARGFCLSDLASVSARFVATSPCAGSRGRSSSTARSEEHTSELQSQSNLVCRLLLEKKKHNKQTHTHSHYATNTHVSAECTQPQTSSR